MNDDNAIDVTSTIPTVTHNAPTVKRNPPKEHLFHIRAFEEYYGMGEKRSCKRVAKKMGKSEGQVQNWSRTFRWAERVRARDMEIGDRLQLESVEEITESRKNLLLILREAISSFIKRKDGEEVELRIDGERFKLKNVADLREAYLLMEEIRNPGSVLTKKPGDDRSTAQPVNIIIQN
jgi:hypothetical protein